MPTQLNSLVQARIDEFVASGHEVGLQVAAYVDGKQVVDAWAGVADEASGRLVDGDTLFTCWSTTKGFVATCIHILADRGKIGYDAPIAKYWPEFAAHGKQKATVLDALMHKAGVPQMIDNVTPEMMTDWEAMCNSIADSEPLWEPGTQSGYHALTFGWILGEIVRRTDGRPIERFAQEELCLPLGIDSFFLGIPDSVADRVATERDHQTPTDDAMAETGLHARALPPQLATAKAFNLPHVRAAVIPGAGGIMNARAIARHYAMLAGYGELDGVRILSRERVEMISGWQEDDLDLVFDARSRKGMGYFHGGPQAAGGEISMGPKGTEFGHPGLGGSLGFADPEQGLAFGLTKTLLKAEAVDTDAAAYLVAEAIRRELTLAS